ncbi:hypothetical protein GQ43DRAFT_388278 [Delitschia confertaspora ATCC 74209]|uniref:DUF6594 domain-containing protein n=1 Tax=Delitschia confertaspora ATCC 74209 TaxID=1513339 RepID=A0A9P4MYI5_9PLEO|nr:hypothetical protein GQ43DRAFT_388278 [Delitschia confertaspora ATCC 74209]
MPPIRIIKRFSSYLSKNDDISETVQPKPYLEGFPSLSALLSSDPDLQVYRRFNRLTARNLLYLQAEILDLETRLKEFDTEDLEVVSSEESEWMEVKLSSQCWEVFRERAEDGCPREKERLDLILKVRERLGDYQDALIRQSHLLNLDNPSLRVRGAVTGWFDEKRPLVGNARNMFNGRARHDMVSLRTPLDQDRLTTLLQTYLGHVFKSRKKYKDHPQDWEGMYYFPEATVKHIVSFVSVLLAATLLVGAITSLYFVKRPSTVIGILAAFTTLFAGSIGLLTNARKVDIYAATAAYAAVLVVFVGNLGMSNSN